MLELLLTIFECQKIEQGMKYGYKKSDTQKPRIGIN